ncbi:MAG: VCBS repeat-containing protein [Spirochaetales bacterium]|nr:VCBS repeat-containing protein [Spirochaetales bacterium]
MDSMVDHTQRLHSETDDSFKKYRSFFRPAKYLVPIAIFALLMGSCDPEAIPPGDDGTDDGTTDDGTTDDGTTDDDTTIDPATVLGNPAFKAPVGVNISGLSSFSSYIFIPALADIDSDGDLDIIAGYKAQVDSSVYKQATMYLKNDTADADMTFTFGSLFSNIVSREISSSSSVHGGMFVAVGDIDGQYDIDIVASNNYQYPISRVFNNANIFIQNSNNSGGFEDATLLTSSDYAHFAPTLADLDGDGDMDLIIGSSYMSFYYSSTLSRAGEKKIIYLKNPDSDLGNFTGAEESILVAPSIISNILDFPIPSFADIDGDGDQDMFVVTYDTGAVTFYLNTGTSSAPVFEAQAGAFNVLPSDEFKYFPAFGDMDGDTDLDIIAGTNDGRLLYIENIDIDL